MNKLEGIKEIILYTRMSDELKLAAIEAIINTKYISRNPKEASELIKSKFDFNSNNQWVRYSPTEVAKITGIDDFTKLKATLSHLGVKQRKSGSKRFYELPLVR